MTPQAVSRLRRQLPHFVERAIAADSPCYREGVADSISPGASRDYLRRFALVAERQRAAEATATLEQKLDELERLMLSIDDFGWRETLDDDAPVRARWAALRERARASAQ